MDKHLDLLLIMLLDTEAWRLAKAVQKDLLLVLSFFVDLIEVLVYHVELLLESQCL